MKKLIAFLFTSLVLISFAVAQGTATFTSMPAQIKPLMEERWQ